MEDDHAEDHNNHGNYQLHIVGVRTRDVVNTLYDLALNGWLDNAVPVFRRCLQGRSAI